jgi:peptide/nickel transport system permease protein
MFRYTLSKALAIIPLIVVAAAVTFVLFALVPGDAARQVAGETASEQQIRAARDRMGLDRPLVNQFGSYLVDLAHGDLGHSYYSSEAVTSAIAPRLGLTVSLTAVTLVASSVIGCAAGLVAGIRQASWVDRAVTGISSLGIAVPNFWLGIVLVSLVGLRLKLLPVGGYVSPGVGWWTWFEHLLLPASALGLAGAAEIARQTRAAVVEAVAAPYMRTAESKGLPRGRVLRKHVLRFAWIPVLTVIGLQLSRILSGAVVIEAVFNLPGVGQLLVQAVQRGDRPIVQGIVIVTAAVVLLTFMLIDVGYAIVDPRLRRAT